MSVPGLRGVEHVGFTVPDLDEAIAFFVDVIGCELFYEMGPFGDSDGTWMADNLDVHPRAEVPRACVMRCGIGPNFELFEYSSRDQSRRMPRMSDWGTHHLAFYVDDMDEALDDLAARGLRLLGGSKPGLGVEAGDGSTWAHFLSPWGQVLELVSFPNGKDYMRGRERVLWSPLEPAMK